MDAQEMADHLRGGHKVQGVIAGDGCLDDVAQTMLDAGWTCEGVEYIEGKRVRYMVAPGNLGEMSAPEETLGYGPRKDTACTGDSVESTEKSNWLP